MNEVHDSFTPTVADLQKIFPSELKPLNIRTVQFEKTCTIFGCEKKHTKTVTNLQVITDSFINGNDFIRNNLIGNLNGRGISSNLTLSDQTSPV